MLTIHMKNLLIAILTIIALLTVHFGVTAQTTTYEEETKGPELTIAPSILDLNVTKKQRLDEKITVQNNSSFPVPVHVEVHDYTLNREGNPDYSYDETDWSAKSWVQVKPKDLIIEAGEKRVVKLNIRIPKFAETGSHFVTIMFQPVMPEDFYIPSSTHIIPHIGAVVAFNVDVENTKLQSDFLEIQNIVSSDTLISQNDSVELDADVLNNDVFFHKVDRVISIKDIFGNEVSNIPLGNATLFPKKERILADSIKGDFGIGVFTAEYILREGEYAVSGTETFWVLPPLWVFPIIIIGIPILFIMLLKPKRVMKAIKALSKGDS